MKRILFVSEAVTLAQVVRLVVLARSLDPARYEIHFASARFDDLVFRDTPFRRWPIHSLSPDEVDRAVRSGRRIYDWSTLRRYLDDDLRVIAGVRPHLVVGDLRQSLAVAGPLMGVPVFALINAYWSPSAIRDRFPLPDHPIVRWLGETLSERHFGKALPYVFDHFAAPLNQLRRDHGLPPVGSLQEALTYGDVALFPDVPALIPTAPSVRRSEYLGPVLWSPAGARPPWWNALDPHRPTVYVTLGSSGAVEHLRPIVETVVGLGLQVIVATAGRGEVLAPSPAVFQADFVPGDEAARRATLVISNGGSTTGYQALAEGTPVLGIPSNLDHHLATQAIVRAGAGLAVPARSLSAAALKDAVTRISTSPSYARGAAQVAVELARWNATERFSTLVDEHT